MSEPVFENMDQAAQALAAANSGESTPEVDAAVQREGANQPGVQTERSTQEPPAPQQEADSFTDVDLSDLPDEARYLLEQRQKEMQADYTRKTQELAAQRAEAEYAVQFVSELQSNPEFAMQVHHEISAALEAAGLSPAEASAEAAAQVSEMAAGGEAEEDDPIVREVEELKAWREEQEARQLEFELSNELDRQDARIRADNPGWQDEHMRYVYALAHATGGNLLQAAELFKQQQQFLTEQYLAQKQSVQTPAHVSPTGPAQPSPEPFEGLFDPRLDRAAQDMLRNSLVE